jgi:hypothetical protein
LIHDQGSRKKRWSGLAGARPDRRWNDYVVLDLNRQAEAAMHCETKLEGRE